MTLESVPIAGMENVGRYRDMVDDYEAFVRAIHKPLPRVMWLSPRVADLKVILEREGWQEKDFSPLSWNKRAFRVDPKVELGRSLTYMLGDIHIQEEVSMMPAYLLNPHHKETILDLCAAPGNKTAQMALMMENKGTIIANDRSPMRLTGLRACLSRLGITNVSTSVYDGIKFPADKETFDGVLCDVPCSCEGTIRKNKKVFDHRLSSYEYLASGLQVGLLKKALQLCRPGGRVVYATCTFRPEENEMVVDAALKSGPYRLKPISFNGVKIAPALSQFGGKVFSHEVAKCARIWPHHNDSGGFFMAHFEKGQD